MELLTQSLAKVLLTQSPAHVRHMLDNPEEKKPTREMDLGSLVDALVFGGASYHTISADDYRKKATQQERDAARDRGQIPILEREIEPARRLAGSIRATLLDIGFDLDRAAKKERLFWKTPAQSYPFEGEGDVASSGEPDLAELLPSKWLTIDLKVGGNINPDYLDRHIIDQGWHIQAAAYQEAGHVLHPETEGRGGHWLLGAETSGTMQVVLYPFSEMMLEMGRHAWQRAQRRWRACLQTNDWPGYSARPLMPPEWAYELEMDES